MHIDEIVELVRKDLQTWATSAKARLALAWDEYNVLELLSVGPAGFLVILSWGGDAAVGDLPEEPLAEATFNLTVGYNLGLSLPIADMLSKSTPTRTNLLRQVSECRARLLTIQMPEDETRQLFEYVDTTPFSLPDGIPFAAYRIRAKLMAVVETNADYRPAA